MFPEILLGATAAAGALLLLVLRKFSLRPFLIGTVVFPLLLFPIGFSLRLSGIPEQVDMGFFFTEFSFLFVYLVFALSFLLGQVRYWKV